MQQVGFFVSTTFKDSWELFKKEWISIYAVQAVPFVVAIVYSMLVTNFDEQSLIALLLNLSYMVAQFIVSVGVVKGFLEISRGKKVTIETFKSVAPYTLKFIAVQILMMLIVLGGLILFIIPGIIFSIKYMFAPYLVVDKGLGPIEALKESARMTDGVKWDLLGFLAAVSVLAYMGILALFVGLLVTLPVATVAYVMVYNHLLKRVK